MSKLIDDICRSDNPEYVDAKGCWWIKKPINKQLFRKRVKDAIRVLQGKSFACHYKEDEDLK